MVEPGVRVFGCRALGAPVLVLALWLQGQSRALCWTGLGPRAAVGLRDLKAASLMVGEAVFLSD